MNTNWNTMAILTIVLLLALPAVAQSVPTAMNYQGRLTDNSPGQSPITGTLPMEFRIFGSLMGPDLLWSESWASVDVNGGIFSVLLGTGGTPIDASVVAGGATRYLEVVIDGEELTPRQQLGSVPFAMKDEPGNELATSLILNGTDLEMSDEGGTLIADLSSLQDGVDDADNDPVNELNQSLELVGSNLQLTDSAGVLSTSLAGLGNDNLGNHNATTRLDMNTNSIVDVGRFEVSGVGSDSGQANHSYAIFQEDGSWSHPYPDLRIAYHTGIKLGANFNFGGVRFFNNSDMVTETFSVGNTDNDARFFYSLRDGTNDRVVIDDDGGWHRSYGDTGWYSGTHGGGIYMTDSTWVRTYNNKNFFSAGIVRGDGGLETNGNVKFGSGWAGTHPSYSTAYSAFWRDGADYALLANDTHTFLNAPSPTGTVYVRTGNSTRMSISGSTGEVDIGSNLDVNGTALVGYERVLTAGSTSTSSSSCAQGGGWTCFTGTATATCPVGKVVVGGGCTCSGITDSICYSYPSGTTGWTCQNAEDSASQAFNVYAFCARLGN